MAAAATTDGGPADKAPEPAEGGGGAGAAPAGDAAPAAPAAPVTPPAPTAAAGAGGPAEGEEKSKAQGGEAAAAEAGAEGAGGGGGGGKAAAADARTVYLAGRKFCSREEVLAHVKKIQESVPEEGDSGDCNAGKLSVEDNLFLLHLLLHHPKAVEKMVKPISHFRYGTYERFKNKCFICVGGDGSQEGVSAVKSIDAIYPKGGSANPAGCVGLVAGARQPDEGGSKAAKRQREQPAAEEERTPRTFEPTVMVRGCVVDFHGLPKRVSYHRLKESLAEFGKVRFLQFMKAKSGGGQPPAKKRRKEAAAKSGGAGKKAEGGEGGGGGEGGEGGESAEEDEDDEDDEEEEEDEEDEEEALVTARCRFYEPEGATAAIEGLKEVEGAAVKASLLTGEEEEAFWQAVNAKLKELFENPNPNPKGKGKKGKGKGKGKKSKGGKGKGGKGGDRED